MTIFVSPGFRPIALVRNEHEGSEDRETPTWNVESLESRKVRLFHIADLLRRQSLTGNLFIIELQVCLRQPASLRDTEDSDYVITATAHDVSVRQGRNRPDGDCRMDNSLDTVAVCMCRP